MFYYCYALVGFGMQTHACLSFCYFVPACFNLFLHRLQLLWLVKQGAIVGFVIGLRTWIGHEGCILT